MADFRYVICDVFTAQPLEGNPLAVFTDARGIPERWLQPLAREINYSETVFAFPPSAGGHARIRIFTPAVEIPFAGHPVLGTAFVLGAPLQLPSITLETGAGPVPVRLEREGARITFGRMTQPVPDIGRFDAEAELLGALGVARSILPVEVYTNGPRHVFVTLGTEADVSALRPDLGALARVSGVTTISCCAGAMRRWRTRVFAPAAGVAEDPATGSAAGPLACHLARYGRIAFGEEVEIAQGAEMGRPSTLFARVEGGPDGITRVEVGGAAVVVGRGEFRLDV